MFSTDNAVLKTSMPALCVYENLVYVLHILKIKVFTMCPINSPQILISHYATPVPMTEDREVQLVWGPAGTDRPFQHCRHSTQPWRENSSHFKTSTHLCGSLATFPSWALSLLKVHLVSDIRNFMFFLKSTFEQLTTKRWKGKFPRGVRTVHSREVIKI